MTEKIQFGNILRDLRRKRNLSATDVARRIGISLPYLSQLESDRAMPSEALARRIADFFSADPDELVFIARRADKSLTALSRASPRSTATFMRSTAAPTSSKEKGKKAMVRLIAQSEETLKTLTAPAEGVERASKPSRAEHYGAAPLALADNFDLIRPSIVAFASRHAVTRAGGKPLFPQIIGTGFVVDRDGIVATNDHVIDALEKLPPHPVTGVSSAIAIVCANPEAVGDGHVLPMLFVEIKAYSRIRSFGSKGPFYGEDVPDVGFVQLGAREIPALPLVGEPFVLRQGVDIATAGFPLGTDPLIPYGKVSQLTPLLRRGVISSVLPFPCPQPHGFTIDVMCQGGASGSPVFLADAPKVVGMIHANFDGTNLTLALPSMLIRDALNACTRGASLDLSSVPTLDSLMQQGPRTDELRWDSFAYRDLPRQNSGE